VERILEYASIRSEADLERKTTDVVIAPEKELLLKPSLAPLASAPWKPTKGVIDFREVWLRYGDVGQKFALRALSFTTKPAEKIGIVGRTGAGKSSLTTALFRLREPLGNVVIDGVKIKDLGLHELRRNIAIIPQDPFLFTGSLRKNIDPFGEFADDKIWDALKQVRTCVLYPYNLFPAT
jgi:ATP-binding cassette subfamily C (CFTR/MRP) protein 4